MGINITRLLDRAESMRNQCMSDVAIQENPGALLGAITGTMALLGRDKLTLITSPAINSFALWLEQLIAESTGKEGKGIIPVVDEPLMEPADYGKDRLFACLRLRNEQNSAIDRTIKSIESSGQPVILFELGDIYDLGAEFFRWEFATAVAASLLGINPFNQPNVQAAKLATEQVLQQFLTSGHFPQVEGTCSPAGLLAQAGEGNYLAALAYLPQTAKLDGSLANFRRTVLKQYRIATTLGYGPRYLHSTGQLHKGGPKTGLFLIIASGSNREDLPIPGQPYTFGTLADAQAAGDIQALNLSGRPVATMRFDHNDLPGLSRSLGELA